MAAFSSILIGGALLAGAATGAAQYSAQRKAQKQAAQEAERQRIEAKNAAARQTTRTSGGATVKLGANSTTAAKEAGVVAKSGGSVGSSIAGSIGGLSQDLL